ncbi:ammonium transporter [Sphingobium sp. PAMC28499]|jgi:Amt family ammonium transporter|uniref:ammonium transporter n=1 Tax=Sphingobium sp. PAMC28499 TaxID=2565554 RepID=UPI00109DF610|nr:ammonium transporter [Sphingobium sp. PAMC28499]QCB38316.1 ammonium transporter [Sphingobium sp. PAMC28499]
MRPALALPVLAALLLAQPATAQVAAPDSGDTGWMIACALLLLLAALPGLMLRHAGLANVRHGLAAMAQTLVAGATILLGWGLAGYSLAYAPGSEWLGGGSNLLLANLAPLRDGLTVPESAFVLFQMGFAVLAGAISVGAIAGRARLGWVAAFAPLWLLLVFAPITHWMWGGGWLAQLGAMDFAGGLVVHVLAGFSALALALVAGRPRDAQGGGHAHILAIAGGALFWVGYAGAVGGWALGATDDAATAILNLFFAACAASLGWALVDRLLGAHASATGLLSGAIAGLAAISASAALVGTGGAMLVGLAAAIIARIGAGFASAWIDDPAHIFAVHGLGGATGALLLPLFVLPLLGGVGFDAGITATASLLAQAIGLVVIALWALVGTAIAALIVSILVPLRATPQAESDGPDAVEHGQQGWDFR